MVLTPIDGQVLDSCKLELHEITSGGHTLVCRGHSARTSMEKRTPEEREEFARMGGQVGGKRRARALTKERRQEIARKAAAARRGNKP
jgi:hypothetical protein